MKQKNHSGLKKRIKVRKSGVLTVRKSCKNHLLSNKSKRQKKSSMGGMQIDSTRMQSVRRLMPDAGKVRSIRVAPVTKPEAPTAKSVTG